MKRLDFLQKSSFAALALTFFTAKKKKQEIFSCAPEMAALTGTIYTIKSGSWNDPTIWNTGTMPAQTDTVLIISTHKVTFDITTIVAGVNIEGTLTFAPNNSATLITNKNVVVTGILRMKPIDFSVKHILRFINIDESKVQGSGMDVLDTDIGLWVMGAGKLDVFGTIKEPWSNATGNIAAGSNSFIVKDATGWQVGDEIVVVPTDIPDASTQDWKDNTGELIDTFLPQFERRIITSISGNTVNFAMPLQYSHLQVSKPEGGYWTAEVANLTRNVLIEGTKDTWNGTGLEWRTNRRAHIFIRSTTIQSIRYMEGRYLGPRKLQGGSRPQLINGRYGLHFHHCMDGSRDSLVVGCSLHDLGNRGYVPHVSHGITMRSNIAFDSLQEAFWWDFQELTHSTLWDKNLLLAIRQNGVDGASTGMELGQGDDNVAKRNIAAYAGNGALHTKGTYDWMADNESVWIFENNLAHSCHTGVFSWQNSSLNHVIRNYDSYNCIEGINLGAYGNSYQFYGGQHFNSLLFNEATAGNTAAVAFIRLTLDGANKIDYCVRVQDSPAAPGYERTNKFIECNFKGYKTAAVELASDALVNSVEKQWKYIDLINCTFSSTPYSFNNADLYPLKNGNRIRKQNNSIAVQVERVSNQDVTTNITPFISDFWGQGNGLSANYYIDINFQNLAFARIDSMLMFQQWSYDSKASPTGVHHLITADSFSTRWVGQIEAQYTGNHTFTLHGPCAFKLTLNNQVIINSLNNEVVNNEITSSAVQLTAGQKYDVKIEMVNYSGNRECILYWTCPGRSYLSNVPMTQLYPTTSQQVVQSIAKSTIAESQQKEISIYPNPNIGHFLVSSPKNTKLILTDFTGNILQVQKSTGKNSFYLDRNGTYYVNGEKIVVLK